MPETSTRSPRPAFLAEKVRLAEFAAVETEYSRSRIATLLPASERHKLTVVRNGLAPRPDREDGERRDPRLLISVGRLVPKKGLGTLVDACALLQQRGVDFRCEIYGDGPERSRLEQRLRQAAPTGAVTLEGARERPEIDAALGRASVFVLPCERQPDGDEDNLPVAILEAMQLGLAVVSTPVAGIPEAVEDGVCGLLVPERDPRALADAIERLLDNETLRDRLGEHARAKVRERFDLTENVSRLARAFGVRSDRGAQRAEADRAR